MKQFWLLLTMLFSLPTYSAGMATVPKSDGFCGQIPDDTAICYEWRLVSDPDTHFIAYGYEDGIEYTFQRRSPDGTYHTIVMVHPVIRDSSHPDTLFWGYPWDITDVALPSKKSGKDLLVSFDHDIVDDGEVYPPQWQKQVPAVLFIGHSTQPQMTVLVRKFVPLTLRATRSKAGG